MSVVRPAQQLSHGNLANVGQSSSSSSIPQPLLSEPASQNVRNGRTTRIRRSNSESTGIKWDGLRSAVRGEFDNVLNEKFLEQQQSLAMLREDAVHLKDAAKKLDEIESLLTSMEKEKSKYLQEVRKLIQTRDEALLAEELVSSLWMHLPLDHASRWAYAEPVFRSGRASGGRHVSKLGGSYPRRKADTRCKCRNLQQ
jgi:hypothetical protein